jgi:hypothetical protein
MLEITIHKNVVMVTLAIVKCFSIHWLALLSVGNFTKLVHLCADRL